MDCKHHKSSDFVLFTITFLELRAWHSHKDKHESNKAESRLGQERGAGGNQEETGIRGKGVLDSEKIAITEVSRLRELAKLLICHLGGDPDVDHLH